MVKLAEAADIQVLQIGTVGEHTCHANGIGDRFSDVGTIRTHVDGLKACFGREFVTKICDSREFCILKEQFNLSAVAAVKCLTDLCGPAAVGYGNVGHINFFQIVAAFEHAAHLRSVFCAAGRSTASDEIRIIEGNSLQVRAAIEHILHIENCSVIRPLTQIYAGQCFTTSKYPLHLLDIGNRHTFYSRNSCELCTILEHIGYG